MKKLFVVLVLGMAMGGIAQSQTSQDPKTWGTGIWLHNGWLARQKWETKAASQEEVYSALAYMGYVFGAYQAFLNDRLIAPNGNEILTIAPLLTTVGKYMDDHPDFWNTKLNPKADTSALEIVNDALLEAYPPEITGHDNQWLYALYNKDEDHMNIEYTQYIAGAAAVAVGKGLVKPYPKETTLRELVSVVSFYIEEHPITNSDSAFNVIAKALRSAYGVPKREKD